MVLSCDGKEKAASEQGLNLWLLLLPTFVDSWIWGMPRKLSRICLFIRVDVLVFQICVFSPAYVFTFVSLEPCSVLFHIVFLPLLPPLASRERREHCVRFCKLLESGQLYAFDSFGSWVSSAATLPRGVPSGFVSRTWWGQTLGETDQ